MLLELPDNVIESLRTGPRWPKLLGAAHTVPREYRAEQTSHYKPHHFDAITAPTLLLRGSDTTTALADSTRQAADAITHSRTRILHGLDHLGPQTDAPAIATIIRDFTAS